MTGDDIARGAGRAFGTVVGSVAGVAVIVAAGFVYGYALDVIARTVWARLVVCAVIAAPVAVAVTRGRTTEDDHR